AYNGIINWVCVRSFSFSQFVVLNIYYPKDTSFMECPWHQLPCKELITRFFKLFPLSVSTVLLNRRFEEHSEGGKQIKKLNRCGHGCTKIPVRKQTKRSREDNASVVSCLKC